MKLLAGLQPQMGLAPSPGSMVVIGLVLLISSLAPAHACMTRSGQDGERVVSHQGEEPEYHPQVGSKSFQILFLHQISFHRIRTPRPLVRQLRWWTGAMRRARSRLADMTVEQCQHLEQILLLILSIRCAKKLTFVQIFV